MRIQEEIRDDVAVLTLSGSLMCGPDVRPLHDHIRRLAQQGFTQVVVDYSKVKWFGSAMLGMLTASLSTLRNAGGDLRLAGLSEKNRTVMEVTHLSRVFRIMDTVDRAVGSFQTPSSESPIQADDALDGSRIRPGVSLIQPV